MYTGTILPEFPIVFCISGSLRSCRAVIISSMTTRKAGPGLVGGIYQARLEAALERRVGLIEKSKQRLSLLYASTYLFIYPSMYPSIYLSI